MIAAMNDLAIKKGIDIITEGIANAGDIIKGNAETVGRDIFCSCLRCID